MTTLLTPTPPINFGLRKNQELRVAVFERDGFTCRGCGWRPKDIPVNYDGRHAPIEYGQRRGEWFDFTLHVDHVYPRHLGGESVLSNLQTLCQSCNTRKGHRI